MELIVRTNGKQKGYFPLKLVLCKDREDVCRQASDMAADCINKGLLENGRYVLGLVYAEVATGFYQNLVTRNHEGSLDFSNVIAFAPAEYMGVPVTGAPSVSDFIRENLAEPVGMGETNLHFPEEDYDRMMEDAGGVDLQIASLSCDGSLGFNGPDDIFSEQTHYVDSFGKNTKDLSCANAITVGVGTILRARKIILLACGSDRAEALKVLMTGTPTTKIPATALQNAGDVTIFADTEAAELLL